MCMAEMCLVFIERDVTSCSSINPFVKTGDIIVKYMTQGCMHLHYLIYCIHLTCSIFSLAFCQVCCNDISALRIKVVGHNEFLKVFLKSLLHLSLDSEG